MSCALTKGFTLGCKEFAGGVKELKFKAFPINIADYTIGANNVVTIAATSQTGWYKYELREEVASLTDTATANPQNATLFYTTEIKFFLENLNSDNSEELHLLAKNNLLVAVQTNAGKCFLVGLPRGADVTAIAAQTGTAFGDKYGYDVTIQYKDTHPIYEITKATYDSLVQ